MCLHEKLSNTILMVFFIPKRCKALSVLSRAEFVFRNVCSFMGRCFTVLIRVSRSKTTRKHDTYLFINASNLTRGHIVHPVAMLPSIYYHRVNFFADKFPHKSYERRIANGVFDRFFEYSSQLLNDERSRASIQPAAEPDAACRHQSPEVCKF